METAPLIHDRDSLRRDPDELGHSYLGDDPVHVEDAQGEDFLTEVGPIPCAEIDSLQPTSAIREPSGMAEAVYDRIWHECWGDVQRYGPSHRIHRHILLKMLEQLQFETLLDVGCGNGTNLYAIRQAFPAVKLAGTDISGKALAQLQTFLPGIPSYRLDATQHTLEYQYDVVISLDVLEHIEDDGAAIANMHKMTKKYVLISTLQGRMRDFEKAIGHVRNYAPGDLQAKMENAGFKIEKTVQWGWPLFSPLHRDLLSHFGVQQHTFGGYGPAKRLACEVLYWLFRLNSYRRGDMLFVLGSKS